MDEREQKRRTAIRFPMEVVVEFSWRDAGGILRKGEGRSHNVREIGAFVIANANACPPVGADVSYKLYLSGDPGTKLAKVQERVARVVRVEEAHSGVGRSGFAVCGESRQ